MHNALQLHTLHLAAAKPEASVGICRNNYALRLIHLVYVIWFQNAQPASCMQSQLVTNMYIPGAYNALYPCKQFLIDFVLDSVWQEWNCQVRNLANPAGAWIYLGNIMFVYTVAGIASIQLLPILLHNHGLAMRHTYAQYALY